MKLPSIFHSDNAVGLNASELPDNHVWFNSEPLKLKALAKSKKLVLIDFWTYSCVNCLRTLPYVKHWHEKYLEHGLTIIGVHTPEFDFEKDPRYVGQFLKDHKISYPVVLDNEYTIWDRFANNCWPRKFLIATDGKIIYDRRGEGGYAQTELAIQRALKAVNPKLNFDRVVPEEAHLGEGAVCFPMTPELYCGYQRGVLGNTEGFFENRAFNYDYTQAMVDGKFYLEGHWIVRDQYAQHAVMTHAYEDHIGIVFHGLEANAVMANTSNKAEELVVLLDDKPVPPEHRGEDVVEADGITYIKVHEPRMYKIFKSRTFGNHVLKLSPISEHFQIYAFTFGGCNH